MRRFYFDGEYVHDIGEFIPGNSLDHIQRGIYYVGYACGWLFGIATKVAAGFGIGLLIKIVWHAIFG